MTFRMDPRAKLYLLLLANLMLLFHVGTGAEAAATALCLLLFFLSGKARAAMALRGIAAGRGALLRHPVQSLEYILMPLLMNSNNVAQDLSAAALTKGIGLPGRHTCMTELRLTAWDFLYPALCTLPLLWKVVTLL